MHCTRWLPTRWIRRDVSLIRTFNPWVRFAFGNQCLYMDSSSPPISRLPPTTSIECACRGWWQSFIRIKLIIICIITCGQTSDLLRTTQRLRCLVTCERHLGFLYRQLNISFQSSDLLWYLILNFCFCFYIVKSKLIYLYFCNFRLYFWWFLTVVDRMVMFVLACRPPASAKRERILNF